MPNFGEVSGTSASYALDLTGIEGWMFISGAMDYYKENYSIVGRKIDAGHIVNGRQVYIFYFDAEKTAIMWDVVNTGCVKVNKTVYADYFYSVTGVGCPCTWFYSGAEDYLKKGYPVLNKEFLQDYYGRSVYRYYFDADEVYVCDELYGLRNCETGNWKASELLNQLEYRLTEVPAPSRTCALPNRCSVKVTLEPSEVWPQMKDGGNASAYLNVSLNEPGPEEGCDVKFRVVPGSRTGAHDHDNGDRPTGSVSLLAGDVHHLPPDLKGDWTIGKYKSGEVSGVEYVEMINAKTGKLSSRTSMFIKVPELFAVDGWSDGSALGGYAVLMPQPDTNHPNNHYGTARTISALTELAAHYFSNYSGTLKINDMSLPWGGAFDLCGEWDPRNKCPKYPKGGHKSHRAGKNVDVDDVTAEGKKVTSYAFETVVKELKIGIGIRDEGNHFHLTFP